ncbi:restriction endonuclease subunit S [Arthrobacter psychrochitiniphilus]|uniref:Restriction endonuclease subunit S n=2 Tax=Arthrobacter psychrochitiniphilus TaxID=291045 RepID=A0A2V3DM39_9MICC|nr:restriction endonuclease subunit S [Arthrobacter psychrochitiniphilus]NYG16051.1 type I restriction enzyme S subunit [Arthrobacter psychrochitiniphilus]PXA64003.1 restriction endonuclease subunit S [Arthrobacter psychrochitiniphilus]
MKWDTKMVAGGTPPTSDDSFWLDGDDPQGVPFVAISDMSRRTSVREAAKSLSSAGMRSRNMPVGSPGTLLLAMYASVGELAFLDIEATWNQAILGITPCDSVDPRFLGYVLADMKQDLLRDVRSNTQDNLNAGQIGDLWFQKPSIQIQRQIADFLDLEIASIDNLMVQQKRLVDLLRERRSTVIDRAVWNGLDSDSELTPTGIGPAPIAPSHWLRLRNKNIFSEAANLSEDGSEELLTVSHLTGITPRSEKNVNMFEAESNVGYRVVQPRDLVINTMWAWMGALGVSSINGVVSPAYGVYRPHSDLDFDPKYFGYLYRSRPYIVEMTRHSRGIWSSRFRLYPEVFLRLNIVVPPVNEQQQIAAHLDEQTAKIDRLIAEAKKIVELANERRAALITAAVTDKIDISGAA